MHSTAHAAGIGMGNVLGHWRYGQNWSACSLGKVEDTFARRDEAFSLCKSEVLAKMSTCKITLFEALVNNIVANCV